MRAAEPYSLDPRLLSLREAPIALSLRQPWVYAILHLLSCTCAKTWRTAPGAAGTRDG